MNNFARSLITLTTDFGLSSPYGAAMKGVILARCPQAKIVDLSHSIPPQQLRHAAFFLRSALQHFPAETIHVVVIDPGVGTTRKILLVEWHEQLLLVPDNGVWTWLPRLGDIQVREVVHPQCRRDVVSSTFHGRDLFAPAAAQLASGFPVSDVGPLLQEWRSMPWPLPEWLAQEVRSEVIFIDDFGNLLSSLERPSLQKKQVSEVTIGPHRARWVNTYGDAQPGELVALFSSDDLVEVAQVMGHAARFCGASVGDKLVVHWS